MGYLNSSYLTIGPPLTHQHLQTLPRHTTAHIRSKPGYPQSNGKIENAVKTAKKLMMKAVESEQDPHLVLLDWRNTPTEGLGSSPAQCLFG